VTTTRVLEKRRTKLQQFLKEITPHFMIFKKEIIDDFFDVCSRDVQLSKDCFGERFSNHLELVLPLRTGSFREVLRWVQLKHENIEQQKLQFKRRVYSKIQKIESTKSQIDLKNIVDSLENKSTGFLKEQNSLLSLNKPEIQEIQSELDLNQKIPKGMTPSYFKWGTSLSRSSDFYTQDSQTSAPQPDLQTQDSFSSDNSDIDFFDVKDEKDELRRKQARELSELCYLNRGISNVSERHQLPHTVQNIESFETPDLRCNSLDKKQMNLNLELRQMMKKEIIEQDGANFNFERSHSIKSEFIFKRNPSSISNNYLKRNSVNFENQLVGLFSQNEYFFKNYCQLILSDNIKEFQSNLKEIQQNLRIQEMKKETLAILIKGSEMVPSLFQILIDFDKYKNSLTKNEKLMSKLRVKCYSKKKHKLSQILEEENIYKAALINSKERNKHKTSHDKSKIQIKFKPSWSLQKCNFAERILESFEININDTTQGSPENDRRFLIIEFLTEVFLIYQENKSDLELNSIQNKVISLVLLITSTGNQNTAISYIPKIV
jgi:hypothetical protein